MPVEPVAQLGTREGEHRLEVEAVPRDFVGHRGVTGLWGTGGLVWVAVTAAAYLAAGLVVFRVLERITKARGALAAY